MILSDNFQPDFQVNLSVKKARITSNLLLKFSLAIFWVILLLAAIFRVATPAQAANPISFTPPISYTVENSPQSVKAYDFNNDGKLDLVLVNRTSNSVSVLLGKGNGSFQNAQSYAVGNSPRGVIAGDFNSDGFLDLAVINAADNNMTILIGNGDGTFTKTTSYSVGNDPRAIAVGDFNNDGKLDLAVANADDNSVSIFLGNGDGTFKNSATLTIGQFPRSLTVGDFNNDGKLDLAVAGTNGNNIGVFLGNGDGTFGTGTYYTVNGRPWVVATGDLENNGNLDLFVTTYASNSNETEELTVFIGDGKGNFQVGTATPIETRFKPIDVKMADFDGNGTEDLVVTSLGTQQIAILQGDGKGNLQPPLFFTAGVGSSVAVGDFNNDNLPDLAMANYNNNIGYSNVLLNQTDPIHVAFGTPAVVQQGTPFSFTTTVENVNDSPVTTYTGTLHFSSSDNQASLPTDYTFTGGDAGTHVFTATLPTVGTQIITATDTVTSSIFGSGNVGIANQTVGTGTPNSCTETAFKNSLALGGYITFDCGPNPVTIPFTSGTQAVVTQNNTTVDGGNLITLSGNNATRVFSVTNSVSFTLTNISVANGTVNHAQRSPTETTTRGGALYNNGTTNLLNANFISNTVVGGLNYDSGNVFGGAVYNSPSGTLNLNNANFSNNLSQAFSTGNSGYYPGDAFGGAVSSDGSITVISSTFTSNQAVGGDGNTISHSSSNSYPYYGGGSGGAVYISGTTNIDSSKFVSNTATSGNNYGYNSTAQGGAVAGQTFTTNTVKNNIFNNNSAIVGTAVVNNSNIPIYAFGGAAELEFVGMNTDAAGLNLIDDQFNNNLAQGVSSNITVPNPNSVAEGGAVATFNHSGYETVDVENNSFTNNATSADANAIGFNGQGGAVFFYGGFNTINNSVFYSNTAVVGGAIDSNKTNILTVTKVFL